MEKETNTPMFNKEQEDEFSLRWKVAMLTEQVEHLNTKIDSLRILKDKDVEKIVQGVILNYGCSM